MSSYLFHKSTSRAQSLRSVVANLIASDSDSYSAAVLGRTPLEYCQWIQKADSWGGKWHVFSTVNVFVLWEQEKNDGALRTTVLWEILVS